MPERDEERRFVTVARLLGTHGNRGELAAEPEVDDPGMLKLFPEVYLWDGERRRELARVGETWPHKNRLILKFDGVDTISQAERYRGWRVQIPAEQRPAAPAGRFYLSDLLGCRVVEARSGRLLGEVEDVLETGATPLLQLTRGGREVLIPFASSICVEVDTAERLIRVELPEGLEELNKG